MDSQDFQARLNAKLLERLGIKPQLDAILDSASGMAEAAEQVHELMLNNPLRHRRVHDAILCYAFTSLREHAMDERLQTANFPN